MIDEYCRFLDANPLAEVACKRTYFQSIKRYQGIDRNLLYKAVNDFVQTDKKRYGIEIFMKFLIITAKE